MRTVELSTFLSAPAEQVWDQVRAPRLLHYVAHPLIRFVPSGRPFPEEWQPGSYRTSMWLFGFIPLGWQVIGIEIPDQAAIGYKVRDNGHSPLIRHWDHWIEIAPEGEGTRYVDRVHVDAGWLTPLVAGFVRGFFAHRQRRWRRLVAMNFDYSA